MDQFVYDYDVYFELYGKKLKAKVEASSEAEAKNKIKEKIIFHKVAKSKSAFNDVTDLFDSLFKRNK